MSFTMRLNQLNDRSYKSIDVVNREFKIGELITDGDNIPYLKLYLYPTGADYQNGGKGTIIHPFNSVESVINVVEDLNIEKYIIIDGQNNIFNITDGLKNVFHNYRHLTLQNIKLNVMNMNVDYAMAFFNVDNLVLSNVEFILDFALANHNELESLVKIDRCQNVDIQDVSFNNSDPTYYINNGMLISKSKVVLANNIQGLSVDNTAANACCSNVVRFDIGNLIFVDDSFTGNMGYAREYGIVYHNTPVIEITNLSGTFGKSLYTSL